MPQPIETINRMSPATPEPGGPKMIITHPIAARASATRRWSLYRLLVRWVVTTVSLSGETSLKFTTGVPQCGHETARVDTSLLHSGHGMRATLILLSDRIYRICIMGLYDSIII